MAKLTFAVELEYDANSLYGKDLDGMRWFLEEVIGGKLHLYSELLGDNIGPLKILEGYVDD